jgi:uncharacterized membrane protein
LKIEVLNTEEVPMKKLSKKQNLYIRIFLVFIMLIAPFSNAFGYFFVGLYVVSLLCLLGLIIVDFFTLKEENSQQ